MEGQYIPVANRFERDMDFDAIDERYDHLEFPEEANEHYIYEDMDDLLSNKKDLTDMINHFLTEQKPRLEILDGYSKGHNHTIYQGRRRTGEGKADYRIAHNWGGYISHFTTGYIGSIPVDIMYEDDSADETLQEIADYNDINNLNFELMFDASRGGRAYEIHYRKETPQGYRDAIQLIDHTEMFVIRDKTIERNIIGAVHLTTFNNKLEVTIYTDREVIRYQPTEHGVTALVESERSRHFYKDVPVVEWWNNRFREGDWENEIGLFDAYDAAQSDTANYMSDLNDATLVINGNLDTDKYSMEDIYLMTKANIMMIEGGFDTQGKQSNVSADYIYKQYDVDGTEAYKKRLVDDIYKLVNVPNLDDERFNNQSGIAIQYKMIGLKQLKETKINYYTKALRRRYQLISNVHQELSGTQFDPSKLTFTFHENMPQDIWDEIDKFIQAGGEVSQETLTEQASFTDFSTETDRLEKEDNDRLSMFMTDEELTDRGLERD